MDMEVVMIIIPTNHRSTEKRTVAVSELHCSYTVQVSIVEIRNSPATRLKFKRFGSKPQNLVRSESEIATQVP